MHLSQRQFLQHPPHAEPVQGQRVFPQGSDQEGEGSLVGAVFLDLSNDRPLPRCFPICKTFDAYQVVLALYGPRRGPTVTYSFEMKNELRASSANEQNRRP